jgi:hypothetical protein
LTHTVELLAQMHMDASKDYEERFRANEERLAQLMDTMNRLGRILEIHDQQIGDHERRLDNLERP